MAADVRLALAALAALTVLHCGGSAAPSIDDDEGSLSSSTPARSWAAHPAIVDISHAGDVYAVSDPHGHYAMFSQLLAANGLIDAPNDDPSTVRWTGGTAILVIAGDMIDKGPQSLEVIDLVRTLEADAPASGGRVIATMGNHEAELLLDPENHKATSNEEDAIGIDVALAAAGIDPASVANGTDAAGRGRWMANLPFGVRIGHWFFSHGGNTQKLSLDKLARKLRRSVDHHGFGDKDITGKHSILEDQEWYGDPDDRDAGKKEAEALDVKHIVFGHDPGALRDRGRIRASKNGVLVKIDTAMGIHRDGVVGRPFLLHVNMRGEDTAECLDDEGHAQELL
jgi:hypothetical protein